MQKKTILAEKTIIVSIRLPNTKDADFSVAELKSLCQTAGCEVVDILVQNAKEINPAIYMGKGKLEELQSLVKQHEATVVVFDCQLSGSQIRNIAQATNTKVIDRTTLILDIFAQRATTNEGKLQVELAYLKYNLPRLSGISQSLGRFGGGVGMRGPGESKIELDRRIVCENIEKLEKQLSQLKLQRQTKNKQRKQSTQKKVAIVGYTNAGKSTLLNNLTKASIYADDKLFATLETTSRKLWLEEGKSIVLTDTVGFIDKLPHAFVDAFASTLDEAKDADLLLHVIDLADKDLEKHKQVVHEVLAQIEADKIPTLYVYNKCDKAHEYNNFEKDSIVISAKSGYNITGLKSSIINKLFD